MSMLMQDPLVGVLFIGNAATALKALFPFLDHVVMVIIISLIVSTHAVIGQFSGPYSPVRPAKI